MTTLTATPALLAHLNRPLPPELLAELDTELLADLDPADLDDAL